MLICSIFLLFYLEIKTESVPATTPVEMHASKWPSWMASINKHTSLYWARLSINSGKIFVSRNNLIDRIFPTGIRQSVPCLSLLRASRVLLGKTDCDVFLMSPYVYDGKSAAHRTLSAGGLVPLCRRNQEHWAICLLSLSLW